MKTPLTWFSLVVAISFLIGWFMTDGMRKGRRELWRAALASSAVLLAWGVWDWSAQAAIETPLLVYLYLGSIPLCVVAPLIARLSGRHASFRSQVALATLVAALLALPAPLLSMVLLI